MSLIVLFRLKGARIVWTAHNLLPHTRSNPPALDVLGRHLLITLADVVFVHGANAGSELVARFPAARDKLVLIPLGNWIGYYPETHARDAARSELGIPQSSFAFLFVGLCAPYKNLDGSSLRFASSAVTLYSSLPAGSRIRLYEQEVLKLAQGDQRIRIYPGFIPDAEVSTYLVAADAVVVPYREILTSGTAMLALSFGRPVLSVSRGFLKDVVTPDVGWLFSSSEPDGLRRGLEEMPLRRYDEQTILEHARHYTYEDAAQRFVAALGSRHH